MSLPGGGGGAAPAPAGMREIGAHASSLARVAGRAAAVTAKWRDSDLIWREITAPPRETERMQRFRPGTNSREAVWLGVGTSGMIVWVVVHWKRSLLCCHLIDLGSRFG